MFGFTYHSTLVSYKISDISDACKSFIQKQTNSFDYSLFLHISFSFRMFYVHMSFFQPHFVWFLFNKARACERHKIIGTMCIYVMWFKLNYIIHSILLRRSEKKNIFSFNFSRLLPSSPRFDFNFYDFFVALFSATLFHSVASLQYSERIISISNYSCSAVFSV